MEIIAHYKPKTPQILAIGFIMQNQTIQVRQLIAVMTAISAISASAFADGTVFFSTSASPVTKVTVNSIADPTTFSLTPADSTFYFALFASVASSTVLGSTSAIIGGTGPAAGSDAAYVFKDPNWNFVSYGQSYDEAGKFVPTGLVNSDGSTTIPFANAGDPINLVAIGWSGNLGTTYQSIDSFFAGAGPSDGWVGESAVATITAGGVPGPYAGLFPAIDFFGLGTGRVPGLQLGEVNISSESPITPDAGPIPEPTTVALALVGSLACLACRRQPS